MAKRPEDRSLRERDRDAREAFRRAKFDPPREAIREWCRGNRWAEENAKAVGNWPKDGR